LTHIISIFSLFYLSLSDAASLGLLFLMVRDNMADFASLHSPGWHRCSQNWRASQKVVFSAVAGKYANGIEGDRSEKQKKYNTFMVIWEINFGEICLAKERLHISTVAGKRYPQKVKASTDDKNQLKCITTNIFH
jgi:hypothetical protein